MIKKLENIFVYIIFTLPFVFILGSALINIATVLLILIFITHIYYTKNFNFLRQHKLYFLLLLIFIIYQLLNNIINDNIHNIFKSISYIRFLLIPLLMNYFFNNLNINVSKLSKIYMIILLIIIFDLIFQYIFGFNTLNFKPGLFNAEFNIYERYAGVFNQELIMGGFLSSFGFMTILIYFNFNKTNEYLFYFSLVILFLSILVTGERSSILTILVAIFFIFLFCQKYRKKLLLMGLTLFIISLLAISFSSQLKLRYLDYPIRTLGLESETEQSETFKKRLHNISISKIQITEMIDSFIHTSHWGLHYKTAHQMFLEKPINGHGFKQFRVICNNYSYLFDQKILNEGAVANGCSTHPHNYIYELLSEQGIFGLIIFFLFIFYFLNKTFIKKDNTIYKLMLLALLIAYIFPFKPTGSIISTWYSSLFWFMLGFTYLQKKIKQKGNK